MKFKEYISAAVREKNLFGMVINGQRVLAETPNKNWNGRFICNDHKLTSLKGAPSYVKGSFHCHNNLLTSLKYGPTIVDGDFLADNNNLTTLKGGPQEVGGNYTCYNNKLKTLEGAPRVILHGQFDCFGNLLTSLEGCPRIINGDINIGSNLITSLQNIHLIIEKINGDFYCSQNPIKSHVLGLLLIPGLKKIIGNDLAWDPILNKYIGKGRAGMLAAQTELIEAGFEECAKI